MKNHIVALRGFLLNGDHVAPGSVLSVGPQGHVSKGLAADLVGCNRAAWSDAQPKPPEPPKAPAKPKGDK